MRNLLWLLALGMLVAVGCEGTTGPEGSNVKSDTQRVADPAPEGEVVVPMARVPASVTSAGEKAVPGIVFSRAEREVEKGVVVYDLSGTANGKSYEVEVTEDGKVLDIEEEDDDDDDDDDDDGEDDDGEDDDGEDDDGEDDDE